MTSLVLVTLLAATGTSRFVLEVGELPVAELRVTVEGDRYVYASRRFFDEDPAERALTFSLKKLPAPPEVLALATQPALGCREVFEERKGKLEQLCVDTVDDGAVSGTLAGAPFLARYDAKAALTEITVGEARWRAVFGPVTASDNPFALGVEVPRGANAFAVEPGGVRWLTHAPKPGAGAEVPRARCLVLARAAVKERGRGRVAVGLVIEEGRAFPHAWVVDGALELDPTLQAPVEGRRYVEFPREESGRLYLALFSGSLRLLAR